MRPAGWTKATALALFALLLLPVNYRAGAAVPHAHALIQLVFEARAGIPVHHHGVDQIHEAHGGDIGTSQTGAPAIQVFAGAALLPALLAIAMRSPRDAIRPRSEAEPAGCVLTPAHPPPRSLELTIPKFPHS